MIAYVAWWPAGDFIEIYCCATLATCESRDVKGLYARARQGEIKEFTGISSPYQVPEAPELVVDTGGSPLEACVAQVMQYLSNHNIL